MLLKELIGILEKDYPRQIAESWDNVGLIIGDEGEEVERVQISLDLTESVIERAVEDNVDLIITHHPPIFKAINKINNRSLLGRKLLKLIKNDINVYTLHTNLDSATDGLNNYVAELLGGSNIKILDETRLEIYKLSIYVPKDSYEQVQKVIDEDRDLTLLGFENVSYNSLVNERIRSIDMEENEVYRVEVIGEKGFLHKLLVKVKQKHSYKEPAYEIMKIENNYGSGQGIGRFFEVEEIDLDSYVAKVKEVFEIGSVRVVEANKKSIKKVAIVNGSGASYWKKALAKKVDLFITGDLKYHEALDSYEAGLNMIDLGHYESEHFFNRLIIKKLSDKCKIDVYNEKRIFEVK